MTSEYFNLGKQLGSGTYGTVFEMKDDPSRIVKVVRTKKERNVVDEYKYGAKAYKCGIGPKYYEYIYFPTKNEGAIVMERFDTDVADYLWDRKHSAEDKSKVVIKCAKLIKKMVYDCKMYCIDIKTQNMVVNVKTLKVRMIDFDKQFCMRKLPTVEGVKRATLIGEFYVLLLLQFGTFINDNQLYNMLETMLGSDWFNIVCYVIGKFVSYPDELIQVLLHYSHTEKEEWIGNCEDVFNRVI